MIAIIQHLAFLIILRDHMSSIRQLFAVKIAEEHSWFSAHRILFSEFGDISSLRLSHASFGAINALTGVSRHPPSADKIVVIVHINCGFGLIVIVCIYYLSVIWL